MEAAIKAIVRSRASIAVIAVLAVLVVAFVVISNLDEQSRKALLWTTQDFLPIVMFASLAILLFSGFPVAFCMALPKVVSSSV